uniref:Uncharacterized protein n=1 Tax=Parascaris equorum TaxID=6256 RepID=A0A914RNP6_PAREQ
MHRDVLTLRAMCRKLNGTSIQSLPRAWLYQNCNEFGHFATSEDPDGIFGDTVPLSFFIARCEDVFGAEYTKERILQNIAETNDYFGGNTNFKATDVIFPNGSDDPWFALGVLEANGNDVIFIDVHFVITLAPQVIIPTAKLVRYMRSNNYCRHQQHLGVLDFPRAGGRRMASVHK